MWMDVSRYAYKSFRLHRGRFAYTTKSFRLHGLSRFAYIKVVSPTLISLKRTQKMFMPANINFVTINITLEGIEKLKTEKKKTTAKQSESNYA